MGSSSVSPESTPSPNPSRVQESPIFSYISDLSPKKADNAELVVQGFPGINFPPFIFRSCQGKPNEMKPCLERANFSHSSEAAPFRQDENVEHTDIAVAKPIMSSKDLSSDSRSRPHQATVTVNFVQGKTSSAPGNADHLSAIDNMDDAANEKLVIQSPSVVFAADEENDSSRTPSPVNSFESVFKSKDSAMPQDACPKADLHSSEDQFLNNQHGGNVGQHQHGINRRLQFDEAHSKKNANFNFQLSDRRAGYPRFTAGSAEVEVPESASLYKPVSASNASIANVNRTLFCPQNDVNYNVKVPKPSSIGLHLNSIIAKHGGSALKLRGESGGSSFDEPGGKSICITSCHLQKNEVGGASLSSNGNVFDITTSIEASVAESPPNVKPLFQSLTMKQKMQLQSKNLVKRELNSETVDSSGDSVQSNPKKKRKKVMDAGNSNGCKRCNCRKTKCLKLYCDCFAAGIYCAEPCACRGCFNRPEYEDTVLESRQQIESRDPLAFVPKVIQHWNRSPTNVCTGDGDITLSSGRHKRGCNCKKSKCLKKYCECYQANVGCSDGCRCEGCENPHGQKEGYIIIKDSVNRQNNSGSLDPSIGLVPSTGDSLQIELNSPQNMTPLTPPFQDSINEKDTSRPRTSSERYLQSPNADLNLCSPSELSLAVTDSDNCDMILETNNEIMNLAPVEQDFTCGNDHRTNPFASCDGPSSVYNLTPTTFPHPQGRMPSTSRALTFPKNHHISSESSLRWRRSPIIPSTHLGIVKLHEIAGFEDQLFSTVDDTPEILKGEPLPTNTVKVSSPKKKRVSPPHGRLLALGSCSATGLRTCRRFVLKGIPPMPSRTPCIQSQGDPDQGTANCQSSSSSK